MNNTLLTTDYNILNEIASSSIRYCSRLKSDDEAFLKYLKITGSERYSINNVLMRKIAVLRFLCIGCCEASEQ